MNTYIYPWYDDENCSIGKIKARSFTECEDKIITKYCDIYDDLSDMSSFDGFLDELYDKHNIVIGDIYDIDEVEE